MFRKINEFLTKLADTIEAVEAKKSTSLQNTCDGYKNTWFRVNGKMRLITEGKGKILVNGLPMGEAKTQKLLSKEK